MTAQPTPHEPRPNDTARLTIRDVMAVQRISGPKLAMRLGVSSQTLYQRLNGKTSLSVDDLCAIAQALEVPPEVFLHGKSAFLEWYAARDSNPEPTDYGFWPDLTLIVDPVMPLFSDDYLTISPLSQSASRHTFQSGGVMTLGDERA